MNKVNALKSNEITQPSIPALPQSKILPHILPSLPPTQLLNPPQVDEDLVQLPTLERTAESLRYNLSRLEYTLSPQGKLRQWFKLNILLCLWVGIPLLLFTPLLTYGLGQFVGISESFRDCACNLLSAVLPIFLIFALVSAISILFKKM